MAGSSGSRLLAERTHSDERLAVASAGQAGEERVLGNLAGAEAAIGRTAVRFLRNNGQRVSHSDVVSSSECQDNSKRA